MIDKIDFRRKGSKENTYLFYTCIFIIVFMLTLGLLLLAGKTFIFNSDPYNQHLPAAYYFNEYMRSGIRGLLSGKFHFPSWDMTIGYGGDVIGTLNYYAFGDPLNLLYIFVKPIHVEFMYVFVNGTFKM